MNENGIWSQEEADLYHASSQRLADYLSGYLDTTKPVYDFGCGQGFYLAYLAKYGYTAIGVDGSQLNNFLHDNVWVTDLTKPIRFAVPGTVMSFETGEHLPEWAESTFIETLTVNTDKRLILSWATPGQPGVGHWNCRSHEYIIEKIEQRGFTLNWNDTQEIRQHVDQKCDWLIRNLLVFDRA